MLAALALVLAAISAPWFQIPADNADGAGMLAHLHALFESGDLLYDDEYAALGMTPLFAFVTEGGEGVVSNHWPIGASFLQAPGWLLGRGAGELLLRADAVSPRAAEWFIPLFGLRSWAIVALAWLLVRIHRWLRERVEARVAALAVLGLGLGTPLLYYAAEAPQRPHLWGALVVALLVMRWMPAVERAGEDPERALKELRTPLCLAALAGLAAAIRPQLAPLALLVAHERWVASAELNLGPRLRTLALHGLASFAVWAIAPALILVMQLWIYGGLEGYAAGATSLHLRAFLLSTHHGALIWCPVLLLGLLGLGIGAGLRERGALLLLALVILQIWVNSGTREIEPFAVLGTRTWTGGTGFGPRKLVDALPLMLPGMVWINRWLSSLEADEARRWRRRLAAVTVLAVVPTMLLLVAAWIDPRVCSTVLDGDRLLEAMLLPFDPAAWGLAVEARDVSISISLVVGGVVGLPAAALVCFELGLSARLRRRVDKTRRTRLLVVGLVGGGLAAHLWLGALIWRSEAILEAEPGRMEAAAGRMNAWHVRQVRAIPGHHRVLRRRLGEGAVP